MILRTESDIPEIESQRTSARMHWLDVLRAVAVLLVIWDHFTGGLLGKIDGTWLPSTLAESFVFEPLAITQYGGFMGVALFFIISGYIITVVIARETNRTFIVRRIFRIFPLYVALLLLVLLTNPPEIDGLSFFQILKLAVSNVTFVSYLRPPAFVLIGVSWTLVIELTFYGVSLLLKPLITSKGLKFLFPLAIITVSAILIATSRSFGPGSYFQFAVFFIYFPLFAIGNIFALREAREIRGSWGWILGGLAFGVFLYGTNNFYPQFMLPTASYPVSALYVIVIFGVVWLFRDAMPRVRFFSAIALISYSLYLVHAVIGQPILRWLVVDLSWSYTGAFFLAVVITFALSTATYLVIERPANALARKLTTRQTDPVEQPGQ